jgi:hypothetical protein
MQSRQNIPKQPSSPSFTPKHGRNTLQKLLVQTLRCSTPPPLILIMIQEPSKNWTDFDKAHKNKTVASRLHSVNTSHVGRTGRNESSQHPSSTWVFPPGGSVSQASGTGAATGPLQRARPSGRPVVHTSGSTRRWVEEVDDNGYLRDQED